ncbi:MAG: dicarboxylate/amino acid:cation symporter [Deltaproteobacteria bacterium]|nr:dicarboxylate/amino acid:cation symporter [Deltaproteobacteria bacterium]
MHNNPALPWYRKLHIQVFIAMLLGAFVGKLGDGAVLPYIDWIGTIFVRLLRMMIVPLVFASIVSGVASVGGGRTLGRLFSKTLGYYVLSSTLAVLVGLVVVNVLKPGLGADFGAAASQTLPELSTPSSPLDLLIDMVPLNVVSAAANGDMLSLILFSILLGASIAVLPEKPRSTLMGVVDAFFQAVMKMTSWIIMILPLGVFSLIARAVGTLGFEEFKALGMYMVTIATGLTLHLFLVLPLLLMLLGKIKPSIHFRNMLDPLITAFSSSSSAATLPVTMRTVEEKVGVSNKVSSFVLPMGATVNMDGTALYECAGVLFIAQGLGIELTLLQQGTVVLTAILASIGAAAVPSAGLVIIFLVLESVNLRGPQVDLMVGAMLAIDRPLDMYRTSVNVFSDSCGAAIIARSEGETNVDAEVVSG